MIRALPMWQPWATLVVMGAKKIETRPKPAPSTVVGRRILIHACKTGDMLGMAYDQPFRNSIPDPDDLPLGALIGSVIVTGSFEFSDGYDEALRRADPQEWAFGDYAPGRFGWHLEAPVAFEQPIPWKGKQGIFFVPDDAVT